jgi:glycosyltransferase involved in cell wall biosynthesis
MKTLNSTPMKGFSKRRRSPDSPSPAQSRTILIISRTFLPKEGGIEEYVYNRSLQDPQQVILLTAQYPGDRQFDAQQPFPVYRWWLPHNLPSGALGSVLKQILNMVGALVMALQLYRRYRYTSIEFGHGYDFPSLLLLSYLLPVQCFIYLHGNDVLCPLENFWIKSLFAWTLNRMTGIVCNSHFTRDYVQNELTLHRPFSVIHPTVRPSKFGLTEPPPPNLAARHRLRAAYHIPENATVLLTVGRLVRRKGFHRVIQHIPSLLADGLDVHYMICGRGEIELELKELAHRLGVADRVHFAGYVTDHDLSDYYATADLFVMLTMFDVKSASIEGFGIVYREAGFFGKPVLATRIGGVEDAVLHGKTGFLIPPHAEQMIADTLRQLCRDTALRDCLGEKGREVSRQVTPHRSLYVP